MVTDARECELMDKATKALETAGIPTMPRDEASVFLTSVITLAFTLLRTFENDEYMRGWVDSALDDLQKPPAVEIRRPS